MGKPSCGDGVKSNAISNCILTLYLLRISSLLMFKMGVYAGKFSDLFPRLSSLPLVLRKMKSVVNFLLLPFVRFPSPGGHEVRRCGGNDTESERFHRKGPLL